MAINPLNVPRVSFNLRSLTLINQLRANSLRLFRQQQRVATGKDILVGSDNPVAAAKIIQSNEFLARQDQILANLRHADRFMSASESAVTDVNGLLIEAKTIALEQVNSFQSSEQRASAALIIDSIIDQMLTIGNQQFSARFLFGGQLTTSAPLETSLGRIQFVGDVRDRDTFVDLGLQRPFNVTVDSLFRLRDSEFDGFADLNAAITTATRLDDLGGASSAGIRDGVLRVTESGGGSATFTVDVTGVDTADELIDRFNGQAAAAGSSLTLSLTSTGFQINGVAGIQTTVTEEGNGTTGADLGLIGTSGVGAALVGGDVNPRLTMTTPLSALNGGAGLSLPNGVILSNGGNTTTVTFSGATTFQDVLNALNSADVGARFTINQAGTGLTVLNEVSGFDLTIGENGGTDATALGIRTVHGATLLADLNGGRGVTTVAGTDLRITDANGIAFEVDL
ncbi:MAG: hypothetical protein V3T70_05835, partial [Phycisphaerae bacterium]